MPEWLIIVFTSLGFYILLVLAVPLFGRKSVASMTLYDFVTGMVMAVIIALTALGVVERFAYGLLGLFVWSVGMILVQYLIQNWPPLHNHVYGQELMLIKNGKVMEENLNQAKMTGSELLSQLRRKNIFNVADVEFAVLEPNGDISALLKREKQTLTPQDMRLTVSQVKEPQAVIVDGKIMDEPLAAIGLNRSWLMTELEKAGVNPENVFLAQVDSMGELYLDLYDDQLQPPQPKGKALLLATLKRIEADLLAFSLETENPVWKKKYSDYAKQVRTITERLEPHLST